jgi:selenide,water dikinase
VLPKTIELAKMGMTPGGLQRNREFRRDMVEIAKEVPEYLADIFFDPQTSGGLLIAVPEEKALELLEKMHGENVSEATIIGKVVAIPKGKVIVC